MVTATSDNTLDYEHFIDYQLSRAQGRIKSVDVGTAVVRLITAVLVYLLAVIVLDHALVLPARLRLGLLLAATAAAVIYLLMAVIVPGGKRINSFYAARTIEHASPEFHNSLINFLDLRRRQDQIPASVLGALEERAVNDLSGVQVEEKISHDRLVRATYGLGGAVLAVCSAILFNALFMHRSLLDSLGRALLPAADIAPPTKTRLTHVQPGDDPELASVVAHTEVAVSAIAEGRRPQRVTLHWSDDGGEFWREQDLTVPEREFDPWRTRLTLVEKSFDYYLVGGDCRTKTYRLTVTPAPMVTELELIYDYPEYTGWSRYTTPNANIDALEGTWITVTATTNRPARSGQLRFGNKTIGQSMQLTQGRDDQLTGKFQVTKNDSYVIWFETTRGETNPRPASYEIKCRFDLAPTVSVKPAQNLGEPPDPPIPSNAIVPIEVQARDDFGVDYVTLRLARGQDELRTFDLTDGRSAGKEFQGTHRLDLAELRLAAGDEIAYWVEVRDNRQPKRNQSDTPRYRIRVGSPLSEEERQIQLARAEDAAKAAAQAEQQAARDAEPTPAAEPVSEKAESDTPESAPPTPKDERAIEKLLRYFEEKDREQQPEQRRQPGQTEQPESQEGERPDGAEQSAKQKSGAGSKQSDGAGDEKMEGQQPGKEKTGAEKTGEKQSGAGTSEQAGDSKDGSEAGEAKSQPTPKDKSQSAAAKPAGTPDERGAESSDSSDGKPAGKQDRPAAGREPSDKPEPGDEPGATKKATGAEKSDPAASKTTSQPGKRADEQVKDSAGKQSGSEPAAQKKPGKSDRSDAQEGPSDAQGTRPGAEKKQTDPAMKDLPPSKLSKSDSQSTQSKPEAGKTGKQSGSPDKDSEREPAPDASKSAGEKPGKRTAEPRDQARQDQTENKDSARGKQDKGGESSKPAGKADSQTGEPDSKDSKPAGEPGKAEDKDGKPQDGMPPGEPKDSPPQDGSPDAKSGDSKSDGNPGSEAGQDSKDGEQSQGGESKAGSEKAGKEKAGGQSKAGGESKAGAESKSGADSKSGDPKGAGESKSGGDSKDSKSGADSKGSGKAKSGSGSKGAEKGDGQSGDAASPGSGSPDTPGSSSTGGGNLAPRDRTARPQPGGGENLSQGPVRDVGEPGEMEAPPDSAEPIADPEAVGLVLSRVSEQLDSGEVDPELLKRLGWTRDDLEQFVKEFQGPAATDPNQPVEGTARRAPKKPTEPAKTTLRDELIKSTRRGAGRTATDVTSDNLDPGRVTLPREYEDLIKAYTKSQSKSEKSAPPAGSKPR
jgi:hypothetical protein